MKILGFYISRTDWETIYDRISCHIKWQYNRICYLEKRLTEQSETFIGKDGKLRFKHNGQFAPDNRSKFKRVHDQLRQEVASPTDWDALKDAIKKEDFGR